MTRQSPVSVEVIPVKDHLAEIRIRGKAGQSFVQPLGIYDGHGRAEVCPVVTLVGAVLSGFRANSIVKSDLALHAGESQKPLHPMARLFKGIITSIGLYCFTNEAKAAKQLRARILTIWFDGYALCFGGPMIESALGEPFRLKLEKKDRQNVAELFQSPRSIELSDPKKIGQQLCPEIGFSLRAT